MSLLKRVLSVFIAAIISVSLLSVGVFATDKEIANVVGTLDVEGTPNSALPIGSGYQISVAKDNPSAPGLFLKITYPSSLDRNPTYISSSLNDGKSFVKWNNLTISLQSGTNAWLEEQYATFDVIDDTSDTTVSSNNIKLINFTKRTIKEGNTIEPTFEIVDYNVDESLVDAKTLPYMTGYSSNASFALTSNNITVTRKTGTSGKMTFCVTIPMRYTGKGDTLSFTMAYTTLSGALRTIDCTTSIPFTQESTNNDDDDDDKDVDDSPIPYIIVDSYDYGSTSVTAGEDFSLTLRLRNTSSTNSLENIVMSVSPMGVFSMTSSSNTFYITRLQAGSMIEKTITLKAGLTKVTDDDDANSIDMKFTYQYGITNDGTTKLSTGNSSESITLPVDFPDRFELGTPEYDSEAYAGNEMYLSVPMVNKGRSGVYNLAAYIRGDMQNPGQNQYIGNLNAGAESSADFNVLFSEPGTYKGEVVVTYEDTNMNPKEVVSEFSVTVQAMETFDDPSAGGDFPEEPIEPVDAEPKDDPTKPIKIVLALLVGTMSAYVTIQKAKAKRSIFLDEDI